MTFEFLIACRSTTETNIEDVLTGLLARALEDNQNEFNEGLVADMIRIGYERVGAEMLAEDDVKGHHTFIGFTIDLPDETDSMPRVIDSFVKSLPETPPISHAVKFEDPLLQYELAERAAEIYALEMKLRRVLTIIYLNAYPGENPFNLLRDENEQPTAEGATDHRTNASSQRKSILSFALQPVHKP